MRIFLIIQIHLNCSISIVFAGVPKDTSRQSSKAANEAQTEVIAPHSRGLQQGLGSVQLLLKRLCKLGHSPSKHNTIHGHGYGRG